MKIYNVTEACYSKEHKDLRNIDHISLVMFKIKKKWAPVYTCTMKNY